MARLPQEYGQAPNDAIGPMIDAQNYSLAVREELKALRLARPANEAEVETKILLHLFRLLGYSDTDRADKPSITVQFGRDKKNKIPDFILYDGADRTPSNALVTIEAKDASVNIEEAVAQAKSYVMWAGSAFYIACNGREFVALQFVPGAAEHRQLTFTIDGIEERWAEIQAFLARSEVVLAKDRLTYASLYLPNIEKLPAEEFFQEYLSRVAARFSEDRRTSRSALSPPAEGESVIPRIPVTARFAVANRSDHEEKNVFGVALGEAARLLVVAEPGSGKSTLSRRLAREYALQALTHRSAFLPIYVRLANAVPSSVFDAFAEACRDLGIRVLRALFQAVLEKVSVVVLMDGLDEVSATDEHRLRLTRLLKDVGRSAVLITSRPIGVAEFESVLSPVPFITGDIELLSDEELLAVFASYLGSAEEALSLLQAVPSDLRTALRSPLFALMAVRVAQLVPEWKSLTRFGLFTKYVDVLDEFFNAATVRGQSRDESGTARSALAEAAAFLSNEEDQRSWSLAEVAAYLEAQGRADALRLLLNTGLVTSGASGLRFAHHSFFEFGLATYALTAIRARNANAFSHARYTETAYDLVATQLDNRDHEVLTEWFKSTEVNKLRRQVLRIWQRGCDADAVEMVKARLAQAETRKVWRSSIQTIMATGPVGVDKEFRELIQSSRHTRHARMLATAMQRSRRREFIDSLQQMAENKAHVSYTRSLIRSVVDLEEKSAIEGLVRAFRNKKLRTRRELAAECDRFRNDDRAAPVLIAMLDAEDDASVVLALLAALDSKLNYLTGSALGRVEESVANLGTPSRSDVRNLRRLQASLARKRRPALKRLRDLCTSILASQRRDA